MDALTRAMVRIQGSYALALMFQDYPGEIFAARKDSPMILGVAEGETYLASDVPAILNDTRNVYYIGNQQAAINLATISSNVILTGCGLAALLRTGPFLRFAASTKLRFSFPLSGRGTATGRNRA